MQKLGRSMVVIALLLAGCDDDDVSVAGPQVLDAPPAQETTFNVTLTTGMEVPVCASASSFATGAATVIISADQSTVSVVDLTFNSLSTTATAAHIHAGAPGVAGPIVLDLGNGPFILAPPINKTFTAADYPSPPPAGAPADFAGFVAQMQAGDSYLNVHSAACPPGEIRAQLQ